MTAARIQTLDGDLLPVDTYDFATNEIMRLEALAQQELFLPARQNGQPELIVKSDWREIYRSGEIHFRIHSTSTLSKLLEIRNYLLGGGMVRIFPKWIGDASVFYDGMLDIAALPEQFFFSGLDCAGKELRVAFLELDLSNQAVVVDDELYGGE